MERGLARLPWSPDCPTNAAQSFEEPIEDSTCRAEQRFLEHSLYPQDCFRRTGLCPTPNSTVPIYSRTAAVPTTTRCKCKVRCVRRMASVFRGPTFCPKL